MANAVIHLNNIKHNAQCFKKLAPNSQLLAIVKANAYGHNAIKVAQYLSSIADGFGVARIEEALELRTHIQDKKIVVMSEINTQKQFLSYSKNQLATVVHSLEQIALLNTLSLSSPIDIWLKIDTGMHRLGISIKHAEQAYIDLSKNTNIRHITVMSHFTCADEPHTDFDQQLALFNQYDTNEIPVSLANTAAILRDATSHKQWIRPGIGLYGANPLKFTHLPNNNYPLSHSMSLYAPVIACKTIKSGESVGYGNTWFARRDSNIAIIAIGYADGYPRHAQSGTPVYINNITVPLVGRVSMDMIAVDITDCSSVLPGDIAELWGENIDVSLVAKSANTIPYELFCKLTSRVSRTYQ